MSEKSSPDSAELTTRPKQRRKRQFAPRDDTTVLRLRWTLHELPSSQHRAGLAGLAMCVGFLNRKPDRPGVCVVESIDEQELTLAVDRIGMQSLFDDVYDASLDEQQREKKLQKGKGDKKADVEPKRVEQRSSTDPKTGKSKTKEVFVTTKWFHEAP